LKLRKPISGAAAISIAGDIIPANPSEIMRTYIPEGRAALVIAHPGHELRVYGWMSLACPQVFVLTDGSGRDGASRLPATASILEQIGIEPGEIYGRFTDVELYRAIVSRNFDLFVGLAQTLAVALVKRQVDYVVSDAIEGYNPAHDVCRLIVDAAAEMASRSTNRQIASYDTLLARGLSDFSAAAPRSGVRIELDDDLLARKLRAVREYSELAAEVERILEREGKDCLRTEYLREVRRGGFDDAFLARPPYYEQYGEKQVAAGRYHEVLRYRDHVHPLAEALQALAVGETNCFLKLPI
jgi:hypothetical protein